jgi:tetratricopeptide (TPR) repeat protein
MTASCVRPWRIAAILAVVTALLVVVAGAGLARADEADLLYKQGLAYKREGKVDEAIDAIFKACQLRPSHTAARISLGWLYLKRGHLGKAAEAFEVATRYAKGVHSKQQAHSGLGTAYARLGRWDDAEKALLTAHIIDKTDPDVNQNLGVVYRNLKQYDKAVVHSTLALSTKPQNPVVMNNLAVALRFAGNYADAEAFLKKAIEADPNDATAHFNLAVVYRRRSKHDLAIKHYSECIRLKPSFADAYFDLGIVYNQQRHQREALESFKKFVQLAGGGRGNDVAQAQKMIRELEK